MTKIEDYEIDGKTLKILSCLPYRLECELEELIFKMRESMEGEPSDFDLKGFSISKKVNVNNFLLINAVLEPKLTILDLDDNEHILNSKFREIGDYLFDKYIMQYTEKTAEKKKPTRSPD